MTVLCIDTSNFTSVAIVRDGVTIASGVHESARHHAENISVLVSEVAAQAGLPQVLAQAQFDAVVVGTGPAPFTGLRAGLMSAAVVAEVCSAPLYGVSSLDIIARQALDVLPPDVEVIAVSDARRKEVYWARYRAFGPDDVECVSGPDVGAAADFLASVGHEASVLRVVAAGELPAHSAAVLSAVPAGPMVSFDVSVAARVALSRVARAAAAGKKPTNLGVEPLYLRRPEIHGQPVERM